jgi:hypothetical protein
LFSKEKIQQGSPTCSSRNNPDVIGEQPEESQFNCTSDLSVVETPSLPNEPNGEEENVIASLASPSHTGSTFEDLQKPAEEITVHDPSNVQAHSNNANPQPNVQVHPRKANPQQLSLNKHRHASTYYHSACTAFPRHNRPENIASTPDVLDTLLKAFSSRARVSSQKFWNPIIASWNSSKKSSFLSLPPLTQETNVGDDGLMAQSSFDVNIKEEDYLASLYPDPHLLVSSMPPDDQLKKHYTKLLKGVILLRQILSRGKTLSAIRRRHGELTDLKIVDISAKDVMLEIDDAEFLD